MGDNSTIEWTDATWNPTRGCSRTSPGCGGPNHQGGCYAEKIAARFSGPGQPYHGFAERTKYGGRFTGKVALVEHQLDLPLRWKKPRRIFVNSMSDLFHENLPDEAIDKVFAVMALCPQHTFQVLTKRAERMRDYVLRLSRSIKPLEAHARTLGHTFNFKGISLLSWPIPTVWLGTSVEDQARIDERIPLLLETPAAVRFLSCEPLLGPVDLSPWLELGGLNTDRGLSNPGIDWVIAGAESGLGARPCDLNWVRDIRDACAAAGVPFFYKQYAERGRKIPLPMLDGRQHVEFPA